MDRHEFRRRREALGSQRAVGEALGYGASPTSAQVYIARFENGDVKKIPRRVALAIRCLELRPSLMDPSKDP